MNTQHKLIISLLLTSATVLFCATRQQEIVIEPEVVEVQAQELPASAIPEPVEMSFEDEVKLYIIDTVDPSYHQWFFDIIYCESRYNPKALSPTRVKGIMQFTDSTFYANGGTDIWNWKNQIDTAWRMIEHNQYAIEHWECSSIMGY